MRDELHERRRSARVAKITQPKASIASIASALSDSDSVVCATALMELWKRCFLPEELHEFLPGPTKRALENRKEDWLLQTTVAAIHPDRNILLRLFSEGNWNVLLALANRPDCPEEILNFLATLPVEASGHLRDRFDVIRNIAIKRRGLTEKPPDDES